MAKVKRQQSSYIKVNGFQSGSGTFANFYVEAYSRLSKLGFSL